VILFDLILKNHFGIDYHKENVRCPAWGGGLIEENFLLFFKRNQKKGKKEEKKV
jgi:hypothetical protein